MRILVTGATGLIGRQVVDQLVAAGVGVRALTRRPDSAGLPAAVEVVGGDLDKPEPEVFSGVDRMYFLAAGDIGQVVETAGRAGVRRVVLLSSATAEFEEESDEESARSVEKAVEESGLAWTHLRPGMFAGNLLDWAEAIRGQGVVREPHGSARQAPVHERDIAEVAATALLSDDHAGKIHTLSGPAALTKVEQVAVIGKVIGRDIRFEELTPEQWCAEVQDQYPPFVAEWLVDIWAQAIDSPDPVLPAIGEVLGKPARTLAEWVTDHVEDFRE